MDKAWHYTSAVKLSHCDWLIIYMGVIDLKGTKPVSLETVA